MLFQKQYVQTDLDLWRGTLIVGDRVMWSGQEDTIRKMSGVDSTGFIWLEHHSGALVASDLLPPKGTVISTPKNPKEYVLDGSRKKWISKVERYKWITRNTPGVFMQINKNDLLVDHDYQRSPRSQEAILRIARAWDWIGIGVLCVVNRDGKFYVVEGQHRLEAALLRFDITNLPCMVYTTDNSIKSEAQAFLTTNLARNVVRANDKFKASLVSGDPDCMWLNNLVERCGFSIGNCSSRKTIGCIGSLIKLARENRERFSRLWNLVVEMHKDSQIFEKVVRGMWEVEKEMETKKQSLSVGKNYAKLVTATGAVCQSEINRKAIQFNHGGESVYCAAILSILRKKI